MEVCACNATPLTPYTTWTERSRAIEATNTYGKAFSYPLRNSLKISRSLISCLLIASALCLNLMHHDSNVTFLAPFQSSHLLLPAGSIQHSISEPSSLAYSLQFCSALLNRTLFCFHHSRYGRWCVISRQSYGSLLLSWESSFSYCY